jgi:hypothetical protein
MSISFRATGMKLALAAVMVAGGLAASVAAASASPHRAQPPPVDHQLCYAATTSTGFRIPAGVRLVNQFSPNGFVPAITHKPVLHCNPTVKILPTGQVFPITNPNAHLVCFPIKAPTLVLPPQVTVTNQFGTAVLKPQQPNLLCVPTWKSLTGPPGKKPTTPPGLNHFTCYPVTMVSGGYQPPPVMLQDEFAKAPVNAQVSPVPVELCLPTEKILPTGKVFPIINPMLHLLCFPVSPTPIINPVFDENQFGTRTVTIKATRFLCPPSTKTVPAH